MDTTRPQGSSEWRRAHDLRLPRLLAVAGALLLGSYRPATAQANAAPAGVGALIEAYRTAWDGHDSSDVATFFTEDADMIMGTDPIATGREAIREWWDGYFARQEPERHLAIAVHAVRLITADVAVLNVTTTTEGRRAGGDALTSRDARGTWVVLRNGGTWRISAMRGMPTERDQIVRASGTAND